MTFWLSAMVRNISKFTRTPLLRLPIVISRSIRLSVWDHLFRVTPPPLLCLCLAQTSPTEYLWSEDVQWPWLKFLEQWSRSYLTNQKIFFKVNILSSWPSLVHTFHKKSFGVKNVKWLWTNFQGLLRSNVIKGHSRYF